MIKSSLFFIFLLFCGCQTTGQQIKDVAACTALKTLPCVVNATIDCVKEQAKTEATSKPSGEK